MTRVVAPNGVISKKGDIVYFNWVKAVLALPLTASQKLTLFALIAYIDKQGRCHPSLKKLVASTGLSEWTICRNLKALIAQGLVSKKLGGGRKKPNIYKINTLKLREFLGINSHNLTIKTLTNVGTKHIDNISKKTTTIDTSVLIVDLGSYLDLPQEKVVVVLEAFLKVFSKEMHDLEVVASKHPLGKLWDAINYMLDKHRKTGLQPDNAIGYLVECCKQSLIPGKDYEPYLDIVEREEEERRRKKEKEEEAKRIIEEFQREKKAREEAFLKENEPRLREIRKRLEGIPEDDRRAWEIWRDMGRKKGLTREEAKEIARKYLDKARKKGDWP